MERLGLAVQGDVNAEDLLRRNIEALMDERGITQAELAQKVGRTQSWLSKRLSGKPRPHGTRFQVQDLDAIADVFGLSPGVLLLPAYGNWNRRRGHERRSGAERRRFRVETGGRRQEDQPRGENG